MVFITVKIYSDSLERNKFTLPYSLVHHRGKPGKEFKVGT